MLQVCKLENISSFNVKYIKVCKLFLSLLTSMLQVLLFQVYKAFTGTYIS